MFLCSLQDSGLTIFPTHRLLTNLKDGEPQEKLGAAIKEYFDIDPLDDQRDLQPGRRLDGRRHRLHGLASTGSPTG